MEFCLFPPSYHYHRMGPKFVVVARFLIAGTPVGAHHHGSLFFIAVVIASSALTHQYVQ